MCTEADSRADGGLCSAQDSQSAAQQSPIGIISPSRRECQQPQRCLATQHYVCMCVCTSYFVKTVLLSFCSNVCLWAVAAVEFIYCLYISVQFALVMFYSALEVARSFISVAQCLLCPPQCRSFLFNRQSSSFLVIISLQRKIIYCWFGHKTSVFTPGDGIMLSHQSIRDMLMHFILQPKGVL